MEWSTRIRLKLGEFGSELMRTSAKAVVTSYVRPEDWWARDCEDNIDLEMTIECDQLNFGPFSKSLYVGHR
jgi:hypothetical protein